MVLKADPSALLCQQHKTIATIAHNVWMKNIFFDAVPAP